MARPGPTKRPRPTVEPDAQTEPDEEDSCEAEGPEDDEIGDLSNAVWAIIGKLEWLTRAQVEKAVSFANATLEANISSLTSHVLLSRRASSRELDLLRRSFAEFTFSEDEFCALFAITQDVHGARRSQSPEVIPVDPALSTVGQSDKHQGSHSPVNAPASPFEDLASPEDALQAPSSALERVVRTSSNGHQLVRLLQDSPGLQHLLDIEFERQESVHKTALAELSAQFEAKQTELQQMVAQLVQHIADHSTVPYTPPHIPGRESLDGMLTNTHNKLKSKLYAKVKLDPAAAAMRMLPAPVEDDASDEKKAYQQKVKDAVLGRYGCKLLGVPLLWSDEVLGGCWIPRYEFQPVQTIRDVWEEHHNGLNGLISIRELERDWKSHWKFNEGRMKTEHSRRRHIVNYMTKSLAAGVPMEEALSTLEADFPPGTSLRTVYDTLKQRKFSALPTQVNPLRPAKSDES
ncbi:uncharacterized protein L969DRAFT_96129 [Mixia osmundae IAM 14324]|uniref:Transcription activator GCR1-like domain-containing protein n=1 Tax=Mixia osmundae (strain CBS 9802 / IAM 14324 / JCM 22182 / KY 12970) TaxID=764103 RepID=G7EA44_MIXOS|nr:uncharacterized protein L969DRAFT_96129 [Mixia osmundae IAM 14324]KEI37601.1 hypothetical protein L969DRAFT_96129 [Mixia osmundae IAM 14324]GAA99704.1 hypothetical protein E5Q_06407 [Mixia osmundae IAM 14324]